MLIRVGVEVSRKGQRTSWYGCMIESFLILTALGLRAVEKMDDQDEIGSRSPGLASGEIWTDESNPAVRPQSSGTGSMFANAGMPRR